MTNKLSKFIFIFLIILSFIHLQSSLTGQTTDSEQKDKLIKKRMADESVEKIRFYYANQYYDKTIEECNNLEKLDPGNGISVYYKNLAELRLKKFEEDRKRAIELGQKPPELPKPQEYVKPISTTDSANGANISTGQTTVVSNSQTSPSSSTSGIFPTSQSQESQPAQNVFPASPELSPYDSGKKNFFTTGAGKIVIGFVILVVLAMIIWTILTSRKKRKLMLEAYQSLQMKQKQAFESKKLEKTTSTIDSDIATDNLIEPDKKNGLSEEISQIKSPETLPSLSSFTLDTFEKDKFQSPKEEIDKTELSKEDMPQNIITPLSEFSPVVDQKLETSIGKELKNLDYINISDDTFNKTPEKSSSFGIPILDVKEPKNLGKEESKFSSITPLDMIDIQSAEKQNKIDDISLKVKSQMGPAKESQGIESDITLDIPKENIHDKKDSSIKPIDFMDISIETPKEKSEESSSISPFDDKILFADSEPKNNNIPLNGGMALDDFLFDSAAEDSVDKKQDPINTSFTSTGISPLDLTDNFGTASLNVENDETVVGELPSSSETSSSTLTNIPSESVSKIKEEIKISADDEDTKIITDIKSKQHISIDKNEKHPDHSIPKVLPKSINEKEKNQNMNILESVPGLNLDLETDATIGVSEKSTDEIKKESIKIDDDDKTLRIEPPALQKQMPKEDIRIPLPTDKTADRNELLFNEQFKKGMTAFNKKDWKRAVHYLTIAAAIKPNDPDLKDKLNTARENRKKYPH